MQYYHKAAMGPKTNDTAKVNERIGICDYRLLHEQKLTHLCQNALK